MQNNLLQPIKSTEDLASFLNVPLQKLTWIAFKPKDEYRYKTFEIPKSNGGVRTISEPLPFLKLIQKRLSKLFNILYLDKLEEQEGKKKIIKRCSHGFEKGKNIKTNAELHVNKPWVLNLDFEDFFPSIHKIRIEGLLAKWTVCEDSTLSYYFSKEVATLISLICCFRGQKNSCLNGLPQGAPTSPILTNMLMIEFDKQLYYLSKKKGINYSRYVDDLSFSPEERRDVSTYLDLVEVETNNHDQKRKHRYLKIRNLDPKLNELIQKNGFKIQLTKSRLQVRPAPREVTGLIVNEFPNVRRKDRRWVRSILDLWKIRGYQFASAYVYRNDKSNYPSNINSMEPKDLSYVIMGKLLFISSVRGAGDYQYLKLRKQFLDLCLSIDSKLNIEMKKSLGKVKLDDFPRRNALHLEKLYRTFQNSRHCEYEETELGAWASERIEYEVGWRNFSHVFINEQHGESNLKALALEAEVDYIRYLHKETYIKWANRSYTEFLQAIISQMAKKLAKILKQKKFKKIIKTHDWKKSFDELTQKHDIRFVENIDSQKISQWVGEAITGNNKTTFIVYHLWCAVISLDIDYEEVLAEKSRFFKAFETDPNFGKILEDVSRGRTDVVKENEHKKANLVGYRSSILKIWKVFGCKN